jgi:hypothetical protein
MPRGGFEPTIPVFEWAKTVHALDRAATVTGIVCVLHNRCSIGKRLPAINLRYLFEINWIYYILRILSRTFCNYYGSALTCFCQNEGAFPLHTRNKEGIDLSVCVVTKWAWHVPLWPLYYDVKTVARPQRVALKSQAAVAQRDTYALMTSLGYDLSLWEETFTYSKRRGSDFCCICRSVTMSVTAVAFEMKQCQPEQIKNPENYRKVTGFTIYIW